jgi:hypothetical protein
MWAKIFHPDDIESLKATQAKVFVAAQANFKEQLISAGDRWRASLAYGFAELPCLMMTRDWAEEFRGYARRGA